MDIHHVTLQQAGLIGVLCLCKESIQLSREPRVRVAGWIVCIAVTMVPGSKTENLFIPKMIMFLTSKVILFINNIRCFSLTTWGASAEVTEGM